MKKFAIALLALLLVLGMVGCVASGPVDPTDPSETHLPEETDDNKQPTPPPTDDQDPTDDPSVQVPSFYEYGPEEMIIAKAGCSYTKGEAQVDGKDVWVMNNQGWTGEIWAKTTAHMVNNDTICTPGEVRDVLNEKQIKYCAITFQLSEGAQIGLYHSVPVLTDDFKGELCGFVLKAGNTLTVNGNYLPVYADNMHVYSNGAEVKIGDPINAGQWYTVVYELLMDTENALWGNDSWSHVAMTNGNSKDVYVAGVRYYTDDSFKTDYAE